MHITVSLVPRLSPSSFFIVHMRKATEGESLGGFDHVRTLMDTERVISVRT